MYEVLCAVGNRPSVSGPQRFTRCDTQPTVYGLTIGAVTLYTVTAGQLITIKLEPIGLLYRQTSKIVLRAHFAG